MPKGETSRPTNRKNKDRMKSSDSGERFLGKVVAQGVRSRRDLDARLGKGGSGSLRGHKGN